MSNNPTDQNGQAPNDQTPQPQAGNSTPQAGNEPPNSNPSANDDIQRQIAELRRENAAHRQKFKEQKEANDAAEQERLKAQGEYQKLAEKHEARVKALEPIETSYRALSGRVNAQIDAQVKDWPAEVKSLVPTSETAVEQRLEQLEKLRPLVDKLQTQAKGQLPGNAPNPRPTGQIGDPSSREDTIKRLKSSGMYGF